MFALRPRPPVLAAIAFFGPAVAAFVLAFVFSGAPREASQAIAAVAVLVPEAPADVPVPKFRDAAAWPHGMVMAPPKTGDHNVLGPPATHDRIALADPASILSALFAPLAGALLAPGSGLL